MNRAGCNSHGSRSWRSGNLQKRSLIRGSSSAEIIARPPPRDQASVLPGLLLGKVAVLLFCDHPRTAEQLNTTLSITSTRLTYAVPAVHLLAEHPVNTFSALLPSSVFRGVGERVQRLFNTLLNRVYRIGMRILPFQGGVFSCSAVSVRGRIADPPTTSEPARESGGPSSDHPPPTRRDSRPRRGRARRRSP